MTPTIDLLTRHRSIRKFTDKVVDPALFKRLIEAGQAAASSSFLQGVTIIRVTILTSALDCARRRMTRPM